MVIPDVADEFSAAYTLDVNVDESPALRCLEPPFDHSPVGLSDQSQYLRPLFFFSLLSRTYR